MNPLYKFANGRIPSFLGLITSILFIANCLLPTANCFSQTIAAGNEHSLAVCSDSTVMTWGRGDYGQLGNGANANSLVPVSVSSLTGITAISGGGGHSLALKNDGTVWAWGWNLYGPLGNGTNTDSYVPVQVSSLTGITAIEIFHVIRMGAAVTNGLRPLDLDFRVAGFLREHSEYAAGEGFGIRVGPVAAVIGQGLAGSVELEEKS